MIILDQKVLLTQIFCCLFLSFKFLHLAKHFLTQRKFLAAIFFWRNFFVELKIGLDPEFIVDQKIIPNLNLFTQISFGPNFLPKMFFEHEILSGSSRLFGQIFFLTLILFGPKFFVNQNFFGSNIFWTFIFLTQNLLYLEFV